jgi:hypothetical protein
MRIGTAAAEGIWRSPSEPQIVSLPGKFRSHLPSVAFPANRVRGPSEAGNASSLLQTTLADLILDLVRDNRMPGRGRSA